MSRHINHCHLSKEALEWINGELLGDGHLNCRSACSARFVYASKHFEYINYVSNTLAGFGIIQSGKIQKRIATYKYASLSYSDLFDIWLAWYVYGSKQIPKDLELTPVVCKQWYIGDGNLSAFGHRIPSVRLATCGFSITDVLWLVTKLNHLSFKSTYQQNNNTIHISAYSTKEFLKYIGDCPTECYKYKWKL